MKLFNKLFAYLDRRKAKRNRLNFNAIGIDAKRAALCSWCPRYKEIIERGL